MKKADPKRISVRFFQTASGREPVREWLKDLSEDDRKAIGADIKSVEFNWPVGMPTVRAIEKGLWEVRSQIRNGIARVLFCIESDQMILLHGFVKKTQSTPRSQIDLALKRRDTG